MRLALAAAAAASAAAAGGASLVGCGKEPAAVTTPTSARTPRRPDEAELTPLAGKDAGTPPKPPPDPCPACGMG